MQTFSINQSQLIMKMNNDQIIKYDLKFLRIIQNQRQHEKLFVFEQNLLKSEMIFLFNLSSSIFYCIELIYRSPAVIDLSIGIVRNTEFKKILFKALDLMNINVNKVIYILLYSNLRQNSMFHAHKWVFLSH
ncbi:unnamed protein product [Rotaria magnacalcarata]